MVVIFKAILKAIAQTSRSKDLRSHLNDTGCISLSDCQQCTKI
ncbi:MAG: hypothetical protein V7K89_03945 [Nostoc sp.]